MKHLRTTSYHPICNGLVELFYCQLKSALKAYLHSEQWTDALPLVFLGIRTSLKEDLGCTASELMYGTTLLLPGKYFTAGSGDCSDPGSYTT